MTDHILEISYDSAREEDIAARLYLTKSTGSSSVERAGTTTLTAYFESSADRDAAKPAFADCDVLVDDRPRVDWLERYEQSLEPIFIGKRFVVAPDASLIPKGSGRIPIVVPQEQAFGTGSHETTTLCLELLERMDLRGKRGLDIGSGSGILAIAMEKLGAAKVVAFDNDLDAYGPLRDNRIRNGAHYATFIGGIEAVRGGVFDVVTMNIVPEVILPLLPVVKRHVRGDLILSGILAVRRDEIVAAAGTLVEERERGEWWAGYFRFPIGT